MNRSSARTLLCLLALLLPFDLARPTLRLAGFTFTFVYLSTLVVLAATFGAWLKMTADRRRTTAGECHAKTQRRQGAKLGRFPASWCAVVMGSAVRSLAPAVVLVAVMGLSAWQAPVFYPEAISFTVRTAVGVSLAAATAFLLRDARDVARLTRWVVVGALVVAALGMLEYAGVAAVERLLEPFRNQVSRIGGRVRISSTLPYPTITSQYLEMALPLLVAWLLGSPPTHPQTTVGSRPPGVVRRLWHRARPALLLAGAALLAEAIVLTFTRAALVGVAAALGLMALMAWRSRVEGEYAPVRAVATALMLLPVLLSLTAFVDPVVLLRLTRERDAGWLQAAYAAPQELAAPAGASVEVAVGITNTGLLAWNGQPAYALSYHWFDPNGAMVAFEGVRTTLPVQLAPGNGLTVPATVVLPERAGHYLLGWDVVQEGVTWLNASGPYTWTRVTALGESIEPGFPAGPLPTPTPTAAPLGRRELWSAARRLWATSPLLGIGPDLFRLRYGPVLGLEEADPGIHANNLYLEILADLGLVGLAAFGWLSWQLASAGRRALAAARTPTERWLAVGIAGGLLTVYVHGLLDFFWEFWPTALLFWLLAGCLVRLAAGSPDISGRESLDPAAGG